MTYDLPILTSLLIKESYNKYGNLFTPDFFELDTHRFIFESIEEYWNNIQSDSVEIIPKKVLKGYVTARLSETGKDAALYFGDIDTIYDSDIPTADEVYPLVKKALDKKELYKLLNTAATGILNNTDVVDALIVKLNQISKSYNTKEDSLNPLSNLATIIHEEQAGIKYPTSIKTLDKELSGGLWVNEVGIIMAPSHRGKTLKLVALGCNSLKKDIDVIHFTCEISKARTAIRYYQNLLRRWREDIIANPNDAQDSLSLLNLGQLQIKDYSSAKPSTGKLRHDIMQFIDNGAVNPLVIIDYMDYVQPTFRLSENRHNLRSIVEEIREIANELHVGIWTASQVNRMGYNTRHIGMENVAESIAKAEVADVILSLNQDDVEKEADVMRIYIEKARERLIEKHEIPVSVNKAHQLMTEITI